MKSEKWKNGKLKVERITTMITALLFILMIALPTSATATQQSQREEMQLFAPSAHPSQPVIMSPNATKGLMQTGSKYASDAPWLNEQENNNNDAQQPHPTGPRRVNGWPDIPFPDPIGDALIPLALLAIAYALTRVYRRKRA